MDTLYDAHIIFHMLMFLYLRKYYSFKVKLLTTYYKKYCEHSLFEWQVHTATTRSVLLAELIVYGMLLVDYVIVNIFMFSQLVQHKEVQRGTN